MIGPEERRCLHWLAKRRLSGRGCVVDAGSFLGASTLCLAAGAAAGGRRDFRGGPLVHAFDYFEVVEGYVGASITRDVRPIAVGDSYLDIFLAQTRAYADLIRAYPGDFLAHRWDGAPIEILFIDIAKTADLGAHAMGQFLPSLVPGRAMLIHQDYFHCWHPHIHIGMEFLDDEFVLVDEHVSYQSRVWQLAKPIPAEKIARLAAYDLTSAERLTLLDRLIAKSSPLSRPMIEVVRLWQLCLDADLDMARAEANTLRRRYDVAGSNTIWARQIPEIEAFITERGS